ncbi:MAG TPA: hypothetical protein ENN30_02185 [Candidatus Woesearchaeota archaeon]|nr:hypothetical protein [Candidatus Woesearchaeota archaeon]
MNLLKYFFIKLHNKGLAPEVIWIVLLVVGLAIFVVLYLSLGSKGQTTVGNLSELRVKWPWET